MDGQGHEILSDITMNAMSKMGMLKTIEAEAKKFFVNTSGCHDWSHVERVRALARRIGLEEKADLFVLDASALLHDIAKNEELKRKGGFCHAAEGAIRARPILETVGVDMTTVDRIVHCIATHRKRGEHIPESLEAKILFDADKLDSIGAVGIARDFLCAGNIGARFYSGNEKEHAKNPKQYEYTENDTAILEYEVHLKGVKDRMFTKTGKIVAQERDAFMREYFKQFWREVEGAD